MTEFKPAFYALRWVKKEFKTEINSSLSHSFEISEDGIYTITIRASCKPGWRNDWWLKFKGFLEDILDLHLDDEDLRVEIDGIAFKKLKGKRGLFNSPVAFSGTKTLGKTKTVVFLLQLTKGLHTIKFIPDGSPLLESLEIEKINNPQKFILYLNTQAEGENYYSWYTFALVNQPFQSISITAQAGVIGGGTDDDDLKIFINGDIQKRPENRHQESYFCGFTSKGNKENFIKELNFERGLHYIELFADKTPVLNSVEMVFLKELQPKARVVWKTASIRQEPNTQSTILAQLSRRDTVAVLGKAIKGERPKNEKGVLLASNRWHKVARNKRRGFVYSEALEISGEGVGEIQNLIIKYSKKRAVGPEIILALCQCESGFFPYAVSYDESNPEIAFGLMQLSKDLIVDLNDKNKPFYSPINNPFNVEENIQGGTAYFKYLYNLHKSDKEQLEKAIVAYNAGPGTVKIDQPLDLSLYDRQTQRLVACVEEHLKRRTFRKIFAKVQFIMILLAITTSLLFWNSYLSPNDLSGQVFETKSKYQNEGEYKLMDDFNGDGLAEEIQFRSLRGKYEQKDTEINYQGWTTEIYGRLLAGFTRDLDKDGNKELIVKTTVGANGVVTRIYQVNKKGLTFIPLKPDPLPEGFFGRLSFIDYDNDGKEEVRVDQRAYPPDPCKETGEIYEYLSNTFILKDHLVTDETVCRKAMGKFPG